MSSVSGIIVPNNFNVLAKSTSNLQSDTGANLVNVSDSPNPSSGDVLTATGQNTATWQPRVPGAAINESFRITAPNQLTPSILWVAPPLADGIYACQAYVSASPVNTNGISSYRLIACVWVDAGVALLRGAGITDNMGGVGAGVITHNPIFSVAGPNIIITGGEDGAGVTTLAGTVTIYEMTLP